MPHPRKPVLWVRFDGVRRLLDGVLLWLKLSLLPLAGCINHAGHSGLHGKTILQFGMIVLSAYCIVISGGMFISTLTTM
jgi:hypothetical protein